MIYKDYRIAELGGQGDALDAIRKLEQQLTETYGTDVALIAYEADHEVERK
ncbi:hypothetical protein [Paenibacillus sp. LHD-38]|uniref:hypothetical protein n=1 Tax=Paenibacillus sp. LHD-38 TaxID=3072143 RepID=UPI00280D65CF|nr:hypothetical protein [Paenibacillus sp. LHD-38]MDQ8735894.1 hypothetical protein [Paenibacillus sp. LHD-38]